MGGRRKENELVRRIKRIQKATQEAVRFLIDAGIYPADELIETVNKTLIGISNVTLVYEDEICRQWWDDLTWYDDGKPTVVLGAHVRYYDDFHLTALLVHCLVHAMNEGEEQACYWMGKYLATRDAAEADYKDYSRHIMRQVWDRIQKVPRMEEEEFIERATYFKVKW